MAPPPYILRRSTRSRRLRITIDPTAGLVVTVPVATRRGWAHPERMIDAFLREREPWIRRHLDAQARQRAELAARGGLADGASSAVPRRAPPAAGDDGGNGPALDGRAGS